MARAIDAGLPRRPGWRTALAVLLLHGLLIAALRETLLQRWVEVPPVQRALLWVRTDVPPPAATPPRAAPPAHTARTQAPARSVQPATLATRTPPPATATTLAVIAEPPASAPSAPRRGSLMDSEATHRAIREAWRGPLLSERAAQATGTSIARTDQGMAQGVADAVKPDCLEGQASGGMGLLAIPLLVYAAAAGKCTH